jgi:hypothetical protein
VHRSGSLKTFLVVQLQHLAVLSYSGAVGILQRGSLFLSDGVVTVSTTKRDPSRFVAKVIWKQSLGGITVRCAMQKLTGETGATPSVASVAAIFFGTRTKAALHAYI